MFTRTESFKDFIRFYPIVSFVLLIHLILYTLTIVPLFPNTLYFEKLAGVNLYIVQGEVWRLVTPIFMHNGFAHLLFNSFSIILFGPALEKIIGKLPILLLYLTTGIVANIATLLLEPLTYTHVGSSGAIYGLFGFYVALTIFRKNIFSKSNSQIILTITALGVVMTFLQPNINVTAHIFGLLSGFIIGTLTLSKGQNIVSTISSEIKGINWKNSNTNFRWTKKKFVWALILFLVLIGILYR